jgi:hypothetical protein
MYEHELEDLIFPKMQQIKDIKAEMQEIRVALQDLMITFDIKHNKPNKEPRDKEINIKTTMNQILLEIKHMNNNSKINTIIIIKKPQNFIDSKISLDENSTFLEQQKMLKGNQLLQMNSSEMEKMA